MIEELRAALDRIPETGPINKARRRVIEEQIFALMQQEGN